MVKKILRTLVGTMIFSLIALTSFADQPPDPGSGTGTGDPVGGGSPLGSGLAISIVMGTLYGVRKVIKYKDKQ